jgi:Zn-dependent M28 family amino/carboxypeptidase
MAIRLGVPADAGIHGILATMVALGRFTWCPLVFAALAVACAVGAPRPEPLERTLRAAEAHITGGALAAPIRFLADDALEGRGPGTRGDALARLYIATQMQVLGLEPAGPGGDWEQPFELLGITSSAPAEWTLDGSRGRVRLRNQPDFVATSPVAGGTAALAAAEVVFVGYGIEAPEYQWDDFKGVDVRGKVLLMLNNDPDWDPALFAGKRRLYYGRWTYKYESAARHGAAGAIIVHTDESASYPWQTVQTSWSGENARLPDGSGPSLGVQAWVTEASAARIAARGGQDLGRLVVAARRREFVPVPLGVRTSLRLHTTVRRYRTANVLGRLPGRDARLRDEVVVYTAHHDHLGTKRDAAGRGAIYNGAVDNAAGIAQLLAVARAFAALPQPPKRSILFVAVAAEEQGLLGSEYYTRHPTVAPGRMVANINFDGGNIWGRTRDVPVVGLGKSTLDEYVRAAAARQGREVVDEPFPERGTLYRSDQFNFARIGVPVLYMAQGIEVIGRPPGWGRAQNEAWVATHYHQPSDDFDAAWNLDGMVENARLAFAVGYAVAEAAQPPAWTPGDEFESARQRALAELKPPP